MAFKELDTDVKAEGKLQLVSQLSSDQSLHRSAGDVKQLHFPLDAQWLVHVL